ncbi:MAG: hypothetical protein B1H08_01290 [Candidatus Omnitrophica bacterium 4484_171]|nr:MAG: hypothetical protein B1H08_01290 [Candidatus Omnitrophica bacterium 4484_171]
MERVLTYDLKDNFIDKLCSFITDNFPGKENDFSNIMCVFPGRRPALFLKRSLARKIKGSFFPPVILSIDDFIESIVSKTRVVNKISDLDACYLIYSIAAELDHSMLKGRESFSEFLPWAREIALFIEQLDLEDIENNSLREIQKSASIGYDVPENINILLQNIISIRRRYHDVLEKKSLLSRGLLYSHAANIVGDYEFDEFEKIIFCNLFYINSTQARIMKTVYRKGKGIFIFQGDKNKWPTLKRKEKELGISIPDIEPRGGSCDILLYAGYDLHTQVAIVSDIINKIDNVNDTVIVLPRKETLIPLLSEIAHTVKDFNISLGYPLKRTPVFTLFDTILNAQKSRRKESYYAFDYLKVLSHPLIKNLSIKIESSVTRVLVHKIEEILKGKIKTELGGSLFIRLKELEDLEDIFILGRDALRNMDIKIDIDSLKSIIRELHGVFFRSFEKIENFNSFCAGIKGASRLIIDKSLLNSFPLNRIAIESILSLADEMSSLSFSKEQFNPEDIYSIFVQKIEDKLISFSGSPLKGLQILGLLEIRSLNFKNVIFIDVNESILPKLKFYEPLIPREIMLSLGINRLEKEEEIQRYQFMRIIASSNKAFLVYEENKDKEKSRFLEELIWERQKSLKRIDAFNVIRGSFKLKIAPRDNKAVKTKEMARYLKARRYSPTMLNTYLRCPMQFYFHYVLGIKEGTNLLDDLGADEIGSFLHQLLEEAFKPFVNKKPSINKEFEEEFMRLFENKFSSEILKRMRSDAFILKEIIKTRLKKFLNEEKKRDVDKIVCLEEEFRDTLSFGGIDYNFISKVDRIDEISDSLVIIDYKSGSSDVVPKKIKNNNGISLNREYIKEQVKSFQLPVYYIISSRYFKNRDIEAQIYNLRTLERKSFSIDSDSSLDMYLGFIEYILKEIVNPDIPFLADREERKCSFCPFFYLCR